ncbi:MAG TPA: T9SS type A sorting domain-containing protein [Cytophagaceae bacterium]|jgi:uncharacterized delta-60 repeat protein|nr:T9SS type A sorting domain-containing protein [Cytophagaceae bacterium]
MKTIIKYQLLILANLFCGSVVNAQLYDNTFNSNGIWNRQIRTSANSINSVIMQPDGKILFAGSTSDASAPSYFIIGRINSDGTTDNSFDTDGYVEYTFNTGGYDGAYNVCYLNNKIYAAANNEDNSNSYTLLVRLNNDGSIDNSFNGNGKLSPTIESFSNGSLVALPTSDNNIVVLGESSSTFPTFHLSGFKVDENANFINGFGTNGKTILNVMSGIFNPDEVEILNDNSILIVHNESLIKIKSNGHLDSTFGTDGIVDLSSISSSSFTGLSVQKDGKVILCNSDENQKFSVYRLSSTGSIDASFGTNGKVAVTFGGISSGARTIVVDTSSVTGKIFAAGYSAYNGGTTSYIALARISSADGSIEAQAEFQPNNLNCDTKDILLQTDGKVVIGANSIGYTTEDFVITRMNPNFTTVIAGVTLEESISVGVNIFPNPASQLVNIHSLYPIEKVSVLDILGNEVMNITNTGNTQIDISSLPKGLYNFVITTNKGVGNKKVSIQ